MLTGVKGRIQTRVITSTDGTKKKKTEIVAEKVTFLAQAENNKQSKDISSTKNDKTTKEKKSK